jgi:hypothetical protein
MKRVGQMIFAFFKYYLQTQKGLRRTFEEVKVHAEERDGWRPSIV